MPKGRPREFDAETALDAALLLFWRQGYDGTTLSELTKVMGINVPSLYAAFGNKEALFRRVLDRYLQGPASYLPRALKEPTARGAAKTLFAGAIGMVMERGRPDGCLLVHGALAAGPESGEIRKELAKRRTGAEAAVKRRFAAAVESGELAKGTDVGKLARYVVAVVWGMSVQAASGATRRELEEVAAQAMEAWPG